MMNRVDWCTRWRCTITMMTTACRGNLANRIGGNKVGFFIENYLGFDLFDDKPAEGVTRYPIKVCFRGKYVDHYITIEAAHEEIESMPPWMFDFTKSSVEPIPEHDLKGAEIERLRARVAELEAALQPFADMWTDSPQPVITKARGESPMVDVLLDMKRAYEALKGDG